MNALAPPPDRAKRARALAGVARARIANTWLRLGSCVIVAAVATSIVGTTWPLIWLAGLAPVVLSDRWIFQRLLQRCLDSDTQRSLTATVSWVAA